MRFPIKPSYYEAESGIGYVLRLLKRNGIQSESRVLNKAMLTSIIKGRSTKNGLLDHLIPITRTLSSLKIKCWTHARLLTPQVCPDCVNQYGYFRAQWQNPFLRHCIIHECALLSECPHCNSPLQFTINLLNGRCTSPLCGLRLTHMPLNNQLKSPEQVHDAYLIAKVIVDDSNTRTSFPPKEITSTLLNRAADILNNPDSARVFLSERAKRVPTDLPLNIEFHKIEIIVQNLLCEWGSLSTLYEMYNSEYIRSKAPITQLWFEAQTASSIIGITFKQIALLVEVGLIRTDSKKALRTDTRVEISGVYTFLAEFSHNKDYVPLSELRRFMALHNICITDVLIAAKNKELSITYKPSLDLMHSIHVLPEAFDTFCKLHTQLIRDKTMSVANVAEVTGIPKVELMRLINTGKLRPVYIHGSDSKRIYKNDTLKLAKTQNKQLSLGI